MISELHLPLILAAALLATASPGPATLAIAGTSMKSGRRFGLALASGITTGSLMWSTAAAFGLGAIMLANVWIFELLRYFGAGYLIFLAFKSGRSALRAGDIEPTGMARSSLARTYGSGLMLHLTNPKAILFFGSLYAIGVPAQASPMQLATVILAVALQSAAVFHGYALLFSSRVLARGYMRLRRWFEGAFAIAFGAAGLKILAARLQ
ncbi:MAG TPA: LysE family translocator [Ferrovibrio sp.]|uniref:LysE family translocator n=1 Tax=Ferrovibrio sp. TaxID=1917215 RepID=UPI002ED4A771